MVINGLAKRRRVVQNYDLIKDLHQLFSTMTLFQYFLSALLIIYLIISVYAIIKTVKTNEFSKRQKVYNLILIIFIPYIWAILIYYVLKEKPFLDVLEDKDKPTAVHYYESGKGFLGGGH